MITNVNILLTISLALFQSISGVWCMAIQQKRPLKTTSMGKLEVILSRNLRDADSSAEKEAATTEIDLYPITEGISEDGQKKRPKESVLRENHTPLLSSYEEADSKVSDQTVLSTFVEPVDATHKSGSELLEIPTSSVEPTTQKSTEIEFATGNFNPFTTGESRQAVHEEIIETTQRYRSSSEENIQTTLNALVEPVEDTTHTSGSELLEILKSYVEPTTQKSTETKFATGNLNPFTTGESRLAGVEEIIEPTRQYSSDSEENSQTILNALVERVEDTTHTSGLELLEVPASSVEPTTKESTTGNVSPSIIVESQLAKGIEINKPTQNNSSSFQENSQTILNTSIEQIENTDRKSDSNLKETELPTSLAESVAREYKSVENSSRPISGDLIESGVTEIIGGITPKYSSGSEKTKVSKSVHEEINSTDRNVTLPLTEANEITLASEESYAITDVTSHGFLYRKNVPESQKESISKTNNSPLTEVDDIKALVTTENVKPSSLFKNISSPKFTEDKPRSGDNATLVKMTENSPLTGWDTTNETQSSERYEEMSGSKKDVTNASFPTGLSIEGFAKGPDRPWIHRSNEESKTLEKKCAKDNISCKECASISPFCHYSHTEKKCRYSNVKHGNEIYECGTRYFITDDFIPFYLSILTAGLATVGMFVYLSIEFYNRYYVKEAIPKEQVEELRDHLRLIREKRLKRQEMVEKIGRTRLQAALDGMEGECLLTEFVEDDDS